MNSQQFSIKKTYSECKKCDYLDCLAIAKHFHSRLQKGSVS